MSRREKTEYQAKVIEDNGLARCRVPTPIVNAIGARPGDQMIFRIIGSRKAEITIARAAKKSKGRKK